MLGCTSGLPPSAMQPVRSQSLSSQEESDYRDLSPSLLHVITQTRNRAKHYKQKVKKAQEELCAQQRKNQQELSAVRGQLMRNLFAQGVPFKTILEVLDPAQCHLYTSAQKRSKSWPKSMPKTKDIGHECQPFNQDVS